MEDHYNYQSLLQCMLQVMGVWNHHSKQTQLFHPMLHLEALLVSICFCEHDMFSFGQWDFLFMFPSIVAYSMLYVVLIVILIAIGQFNSFNIFLLCNFTRSFVENRCIDFSNSYFSYDEIFGLCVWVGAPSPFLSIFHFLSSVEVSEIVFALCYRLVGGIFYPMWWLFWIAPIMFL